MRESPKYFALGLKLGLLDGNQVQNWVIEQIRTNDSPSDMFLDLAYLDDSDVKEMYSKLLAMPDDRDDFNVLRGLLSIVQDTQLNNLDFCKQLAEGLYAVYVENNYECPSDFNEIGFLDDAFCLAMQNTYGSLEDAHRDLIEFVHSFRQNC